MDKDLMNEIYNTYMSQQNLSHAYLLEFNDTKEGLDISIDLAKNM